MISIIVATDQNLGIGYKKGGLPWNITSESKYYRNIVKDHLLVMSSKNFEYSHQKNISDKIVILSENKNREYYFAYPQVLECFSTIRELLVYLRNIKDEVFVLGGGQIYSAILPWTSKLYISTINFNSDADIFFPNYKHYDWHTTESKEFKQELEAHSWNFSVFAKDPLNILF